MFVCVDRQEDQRELYFSLDNLFALDCSKRKVRGVYIIFKNDICLYVGQSKNVASRLATHLSGKYENADKILIYEDDNLEDDLIPSEKYAIKMFKPIENILADYSEQIPLDSLIGCFYDYEKNAPLFYSYKLLVSNSQIFLCNSESYNDFISFSSMQDSLKEDMEIANG